MKVHPSWASPEDSPAIALTGDATRAVSGSTFGAHVWDIAAPGHGGELVTAPRSVDVGDWLWAVAPAGAARVAVATDRGRVELWDVLAGTRLAAVLTHGAEALDVAVAADGRTAATASNDETVTILDLAAR